MAKARRSMLALLESGGTRLIGGTDTRELGEGGRLLTVTSDIEDARSKSHTVTVYTLANPNRRAGEGFSSARASAGEWPRFITDVIILPGGAVMITLKLTTVGNSTGVILPKEILQRLRVDRGDTLYVLETPSGIELTPYSPELAAQMDVAERVMREDRDMLRKLAG